MHTATYQPAESAARAIEKHFHTHFHTALNKGDDNLAPYPTQEVIHQLIDVCFWASLRKEEGISPKISLVYLAPENTVNALLFARPLQLLPRTLLKVAPGVSHAGIHLGVWHHNGQLKIWGTTQNIPNLCFVINVLEPGLLIIKHRRMYSFSKFTNIAVLKGNRLKLINESMAEEESTPQVIKALIDFRLLSAWNDPCNVLIQLFVFMRAHQRGGCIIQLPQNSPTWKRCVIQPITYASQPYFAGLANLIKNKTDEKGELYYVSALAREAGHIANLTAVDGATIIDDDFNLLAFGAKLVRSTDRPVIDYIYYTEPIQGTQPQQLSVSDIGGTRHISAAQFVFDNHDATAFVASQDGHFTVFTWSDQFDMVRGYRIDSLLL